MARPRIKINWDEFDKLCVMQATLEEIASWFDCSVDTIERACSREKKKGFAEYFQQKAGRGKISLRRKQFEMAQSGDRTMLVWLGKQYLKQTDKVDQNTKVEDKRQTPEELRAELELLRAKQESKQVK